MARADLALLLLDSSIPLHDEDYQLFDTARERPLILVANKSDIGLPQTLSRYRQAFPNQELVVICAKNSDGLRDLEEAIFTKVTGCSTGWDPGHTAAPNVRHKAAMLNAISACREMIAGLALDLSPDLLAIELQTAIDHLGDIVGHTTTEDVLDKIFGEFCIGK